MKKLYYEIWVDCILRVKNFDDDLWQLKTMMINSFAMGVAFMVFMTIFEVHIINHSFYHLNLEIYFNEAIATLLSSLILFFMPFVLINYYLIFYKNKYEKLIETYEYHNGKYAITFFLCCISTVLLSFLMLILFEKV